MESLEHLSGDNGGNGNLESHTAISDIDIDLDLDSKVYCANCNHCVLIKVATGNNGQYVLRVKCQSKQWKKKLGEEKIYKFFTVARRTVDTCDNYEPMGELKSFLKDLRKSLPIKDEVYAG